MTLEKKPGIVERFFAAWPTERWKDVTVLVAVSGGADSVALLRLLHAQSRDGDGRLIIAHLNHQLRAEAESDEQFVMDLAGQLDAMVHTAREPIHELAKQQGVGLETAARAARHRFLSESAERFGARYVATAHTADDQAETILHRIVRGTGLAGLAGIPRVRPLGPTCALIRPLLLFRRQELRDYLATIGQSFREDASNLDQRFTRNRLRHDLLPKLAADYNPQVVEALLRLGALADEARGIFVPLVDALLSSAVEDCPDGVLLHRAALIEQSPYLVRELLIAIWKRRGWHMRAMGYEEWQRLSATARSTDDESFTLPGDIQVCASDDSLMLSQPRT